MATKDKKSARTPAHRRAEAKGEQEGRARRRRAARTRAPASRFRRRACTAYYQDDGPRAADEAVRAQEPAPGPDAREDRAQRRRRARRSSSRSSSTTSSRSWRSITGQQPVRTKAKKSIANFGLREGQEIGASVTLRGARMWEFLDRFIDGRDAAHPRLPRPEHASFDGRGNYSLGVKEQMIFPEINYDMIESDPRDGHHVRDDGARATTTRSRCCKRAGHAVPRRRQADRGAAQS